MLVSDGVGDPKVEKDGTCDNLPSHAARHRFLVPDPFRTLAVEDEPCEKAGDVGLLLLECEEAIPVDRTEAVVACQVFGADVVDGRWRRGRVHLVLG